MLFEHSAFENANSECKRVMRPLNARSAQIHEWIRNTADMASHVHDATLTEEVISKSFKKNQNVRCFNCGNPGH